MALEVSTCEDLRAGNAWFPCRLLKERALAREEEARPEPVELVATETLRAGPASTTLTTVRSWDPWILLRTAGSSQNGGKAYTVLIPDQGTNIASTYLALGSGNGDASCLQKWWKDQSSVSPIWRTPDPEAARWIAHSVTRVCPTHDRASTESRLPFWCMQLPWSCRTSDTPHGGGGMDRNLHGILPHGTNVAMKLRIPKSLWRSLAMTQGRDLQGSSVLRTLIPVLGRGATVCVHVSNCMPIKSEVWLGWSFDLSKLIIQPRCWRTLMTKLACIWACAGDEARISQSSRYTCKRTPLSRNRETNGRRSLVNSRGEIASPKGRHVNW